MPPLATSITATRGVHTYGPHVHARTLTRAVHNQRRISRTNLLLQS